MNSVRLTTITVAVVMLLLCGTTQVWAGAWTMPQGKLYTRLAYSEYEAQRYFNENGTTHNYSPNEEYKAIYKRKDNNPREFDYDEQTWSFYGEYGLFDSLTLIGSFDYKEAEWTYQGHPGSPDKTAKSSGLADINLGLRYRLLQTDKGVLSLQGMYKTGEAYDEKDQDLTADIQLGDGQDDFELRLQYGQSLYPLIPGYMNIEAGYRWRTQEYSDQLRYLIEAGVDITSALYFRTKLDAYVSVGNGDDQDKDSNGVDIELNSVPYESDLGKLELTLGYKITQQYSVEASYFNELYGASTTKGETWSLAIAATLF